MQYRRLAKTDMDVSVICFGAWGIIGGFNWGPQDEQDSLAALRAAYDAGINFYDTAEGYGNGSSEQLLAQALGDVRDKILIATKVSPGHFVPAELRSACERSLRNLKTDRIDLYQLHWPNHDIPVAETFAVLEALKAAGKVRAYGVSNFGPRDLGEALASGFALSSNQLSYSLLFRAIEYEILPMCVQANVSVLTYSSLMQGLLAGKYASADEVQPDRARTRHYAGTHPHARHGEAGHEAETFAAVAAIKQIAGEMGQPMANVALAWLIAQPGVTSVIAGARDAGQARGVAGAGDLVLSPDVLARLSHATESLKHSMGSNADMWDHVSRMR
ncbi:MAG: aldo/keto reductase [Chloroflexi bacterium]|nr:aldo/keto reductase [Chloroflexota bacterium]